MAIMSNNYLAEKRRLSASFLICQFWLLRDSEPEGWDLGKVDDVLWCLLLPEVTIWQVSKAFGKFAL